MAKKNSKYTRSNKYKHVVYYHSGQYTYIYPMINGMGKKSFNTERECALAVDKHLISKGKEPVNILKPKQ